MSTASPHPRRWIALLIPGALTPAGLVLRAVFLALGFAVLHIAGFRENTTFLSGTSPSGAPLTQWVALTGWIYVLGWMAFVTIVPILILAAALLYLWCRHTSHPEPSEPSEVSHGEPRHNQL